jgi:hypothetical protein
LEFRIVLVNGSCCERERERGRQRRRGKEKEEQEETRERREKKFVCGRLREEKRSERSWPAVDRGGRELRMVGTAVEQQQRGCGR